MNAHPPPRSRDGLFGRPILTVTIALAVIAGAGIGGVALANRDAGPGPRWQSAPASASTAGRTPAKRTTTAPTVAAADSITLSATGDIIMGSSPDKLPANDGDGFF